MGNADLSSIELRYLRYFVALAEELNFRRASERMHVSTPALSVQIKKLEGALGVRLCERTTSKVRLTPPGEVMLREARELLRQAQVMVDNTRDAAHGNRGRLRIGIPGSFSHSFMPETLKAYRRHFPKVDITLLDFGVNEEQMEALEEGRIHIGFIYSFEPPRLKGMSWLLTIDMPMRAVVGLGHPLAALEQVPLTALASYPVLAIQRYEQQTSTLLARLHKAKIKPASIRKTSSFTACMAMLESNEGVALLPEMRIMLQNPRLALRPIKEAPPGLRLQLHAVWIKAGASQQVLNFIELLRKAGVQHD